MKTCRAIFLAMAAALFGTSTLLAAVLPATGQGFLAFLAAAIPATALFFLLVTAARSAGDMARAEPGARPQRTRR